MLVLSYDGIFWGFTELHYEWKLYKNVKECKELSGESGPVDGKPSVSEVATNRPIRSQNHPPSSQSQTLCPQIPVKSCFQR